MNLPSVAPMTISGAQMPYVETVRDISAVGNVTAQSAYYMRIDRLLEALPVSTMKINNGTVVAGNVDVGIYLSDGTTLTLVVSTGATALAGNDLCQAISLTAAARLQAHLDYYFGFVSSSASPFGRFAGRATASALGNRSLVKAAVGLTLPATQSIAAASAWDFPYWIAAL